MERLMLLDGYGLVYRGYFALPPLTTSKGELVNGVFGFASIVLRGIQDLQPDYLAVSFDLPGPTFRHEQYADYKATRVKMPDDLRDQFPKVREVVKALRIPVYEMPGYEADDVIGTITRQLDPRDDLETTIVTVDLDMLQLVTPRVRLMTTRSGVENTVIYDVDRIDERFGLRPDQMIDYKALKGDPTDNIPGVPGVGEKTAAKLIREFGDLDVAPRPPRRGDPAQARRQAARARRADPHGPGPLDHRARPADRVRPRGRPPGRLRPGHGRPAVPRVRVPDAHRAPAADGRRERRGTARQLRSVAESGYVPAARVAGGAPRAGAPVGRSAVRKAGQRGAPAAPRLRRRLGFGAGSSRATRAGATVRAGRRPADGARRGHPGPGPDRGPRGRPDRRPGALARRAARGRGRARRRRSATATRHAALPGRGRDGWSGRGRRWRRGDGCPSPPARAAPHPARRARGQAGPRRGLRRVTCGRAPAGRVRHADRRLYPERGAAQPVDRRRRRREPRPDPAAGGRAAGDGPGRAGGPRRTGVARAPRAPDGRGRAGAPVPRSRAAAHPGARPDGGDGRRPRSRGARDARARVRVRDRPARARDLHGRRARVQPRQPQAARAGPVLRARPAQGPADEDRLLDRCLGPRGAAPGPPDDRQAPRVAGVHEAALDVCRSPADADRRRRPPPHDVPPGRRGHRSAVVVRSESPEHPDPDRAGPAHPAGLRGRRAGARPAGRRLLADRAAHPRPRVRRRAPQGRVRARRRHPPRDRRPGPAQGARGHHPRRALDGQDGQLRAGLRDERLRAGQRGPTSRARRPRSSSTATSRPTPGSATT